MKKIVVIFLSVFVFISLLYPVQTEAYGSDVAPYNLEECSGQTTINSEIQGKIIVRGRWILRNNNTWSYSENFTTSGTNTSYSYSGEIVTREDSLFTYVVYEMRNNKIVETYYIDVYMTCSL